MGVRLVLQLATHVIVAKMRFTALATIVFRLTGSRAWDADLFPAAYQAVFTDSENTINQPIQTGLENIQNAVSVDLVETITCLDTLTPVEGKKCFNMAIEYVSSSTKIVSSYTRQRFRNLFIPGYAKKSFAMMLFDQSFHYWDTDGFNDRNHEVVLECAKRFCQPKTTLIAAELTKVTKNFNVGIGKPTGSKVAGRHYDLNWKAMIDIYNSHKLTDTHADTYNIWMPGGITAIDAVWPTTQVFHTFNFNTSTLELWEGEDKSWFTAAKFAALHHFHYYFLFGPDRIFATAASNKPLNEFLTRAQDMLGNDTIDNLKHKQVDLLEWAAQPRFSRGEEMTEMVHFQVKLHTYGKLFMLNRSNAYKAFIKQLATPSSWFTEGGLARLGYEETEARLNYMDVFVKCITSIRFYLWIRQLSFDGLLWFYIFAIIVPISIVMVFLAFFFCKSLQCCCVGYRFCAGCIAGARERRCFCLYKIGPKNSVESYDDEGDDYEEGDEDSYEGQ